MNFGDKPTTTTGSSMGVYPSWMREDMLEAQDAYKKLYESNLKRGYRPYTGMTTAGFTPEQIASQQGLASLVGSQAPIQQEALGLTRGVTSEFTPDQAQKYMSPYLRASLDAQKAAAQRQFEGTKLPQLEAEAVAAGGMSGLGSRAGVQFAEAQAGQNRLLADLEATGQQKAYEDAQNLFKSQKERERQTALALQNLNKEIFTGGIKEQALLDTIGTEKQKMAQQMLDEAQTKYYDKEEFARNELNKWYQSLLGNPIWKQPNYQTAGQQYGGGPGMGKTLLSLAGIGLGLGGFKLPTFKGGGSIRGGLASTSQARPYMNYMRRNMGGQVMPPVVYRQTGGGGGLKPYIDSAEQGEETNIVSDIPNVIKENMPFKSITGDVVGTEEAFAKREKNPTMKIAESPVASETALPPITSLYDVEKIVLGSSAQIAKDKVAEATANRAANEKEIKGIRRETEAFQKTQQKRFNKYQDMVKKLVGDDPNANRRFWFTVAAAIAEPGGNAATNFVKGMNKATLDADADRKEKNKMFMRLAKDEMEFMKDVDTLGFKSEIKLLGLTKAQEKELAGLDSSIRKAFMEEYKIHGDYLKAMNAANKLKKGEKEFDIKEKRLTAGLDNQTLKRIKGDVALRLGHILDDNDNLVQANGQNLTEPQSKLATRYISSLANIYKYSAKGDRIEGMTQANIALGRWSSKKLPTPSAAKIQQLKDNPTNQMKALFDIAFGPYAAEKALGN
tara:strand:- start:4755 stop:6947 length:2193 start_codon:yes stop_codon:yes gene_type:complete